MAEKMVGKLDAQDEGRQPGDAALPTAGPTAGSAGRSPRPR
jgi:hypothetical protein